jgi:hypothetical protein
MRTALDAAPSVLNAHETNRCLHTQARMVPDLRVPRRAKSRLQLYDRIWRNVNFPELITFSLSQEIAHDTFWHIYRELKAGQSFAIRQPVENVFEQLKAAFLPVSQQHFKDHLGWNRWFYGGDCFKCVQLVWPDRDGKFP